MFVDQQGCGVAVESLVIEDKSAIRRARDLHILAMIRRGYPAETVACYFNVSVRTVQRRAKAIPLEARAYHGRCLDGLGDPLRAVGA